MFTTPESLGIPWSERIIEDDDTGCWLWIGCVSGGGYGVLQSGGKQTSAHRIVYEFVHGSISPGLVLDHLCRVEPCVNPDHLEPVTQQENVRRGGCPEAQRRRHRGQTRCKKGHPLVGDNLAIYSSRDGTPAKACRICKRTSSLESWRRRRREGTQA